MGSGVVGFLVLGLGLVDIMVESLHRKWQGASVSDFGLGSLDGTQDGGGFGVTVGSFNWRWGELAMMTPGANRLAAMDF